MIVFNAAFKNSYDPEGWSSNEFEDMRVSIECLDGETTDDPAEATHELVHQGEAITKLPRLDRAEIKSRVNKAMEELMGKAPKPKVALVPIFSFDKLTQAPSTQYFGDPWMPNDARWPLYEDTPMDFVLQIDLSSLPGPHWLAQRQSPCWQQGP